MGLTRSTIADGTGSSGPSTTVLAIASGGGHWIQLLRLQPAFDGCHVVFASTRPSDRDNVADSDFTVVPNANRHTKVAAVWSALHVTLLVIRKRPDVVVTTGALPGYFAVRAARLVRARTIWVDSVANAEILSLSGRHAGPHVDLWVTQWEHLATPEGPLCFGTVFG